MTPPVISSNLEPLLRLLKSVLFVQRADVLALAHQPQSVLNLTLATLFEEQNNLHA